MLCDAPRGQKDLAKLARRLTQAPTPRLGHSAQSPRPLSGPQPIHFLALAGPVGCPPPSTRPCWPSKPKCAANRPRDDLIVVDGKEPNHGPGDAILSAVTVPSQFYLGSALVDYQDQ